MEQTDKWSEYWNDEGASGEVFVNRQGERHPQLAAYWQQQLSRAQTTSKIIDLACGAGSVFADLGADLGERQPHILFGADLSLDALRLLRERLPSTHVVACSSSRLPFSNHSFDLVVSQFGVEYAGMEGFIGAGSLVTSGGSIAILCHLEDGYIDASNKSLLTGAEKILELDFIDKSIALVEAVFSGKSDRFLNAQSTFTLVERKASAMLRQHPGGVHGHLYFGFKQLFERRAQYDASDITDWLKSMSLDVEKNILRLTEMRNAASSEENIRQICRQLTKLGLRNVDYSPFVISGNELPIAWSITGERI